MSDDDLPKEGDDAGKQLVESLPAAVGEVVDAVSTDDYIKATIDAGNRVRSLIYLLSFATIISLLGFWNAYSSSWINDRFNTIYEADEQYFPDTSRLQKKIVCAIAPDEKKRIDSFMAVHEINTKPKLEAYKKIYTTLKEGIYTVKVPILGVQFDINDLGVFCGATFGFLYLLLVLAIGREHDNLVIAFNYAAKNAIIGKVYYYLAMGQMLADPPKPPYENYRPFWIRKNIVKCLFLIPVVCEAFIMVYDFRSYHFGSFLDPKAAYDGLVVSCVLSIFNSWMAWSCVHRELEMDKLWARYCKKIPESEIQTWT